MGSEGINQDGTTGITSPDVAELGLLTQKTPYSGQDKFIVPTPIADALGEFREGSFELDPPLKKSPSLFEMSKLQERC